MLRIKFEVLARIEHDYVVYVPAGTVNPPDKAVSVGRGLAMIGAEQGHIPVNASGTIELSFEQAEPLLKSGAIRRKS